jgi:glycosyltransferase involved in cell wall biosynthesis
MNISCVIITKNRSRQLKDCIAHLLNQQVLPKEIVVIEDVTDNQFFSSSSLRKYVSKTIDVQYKKVKNGNYAVSRNSGLNAARSEIILFVDDDVILPPNYLSITEKLHIQHPDIFAFVGHVLPKKNDIFSHFGSYYMNWTYRLSKKPQKIPSFAFSTISMKKKLVTRHKLSFDEGLNTGEDHAFLKQAHLKNLTLMFHPTLKSVHDFRSNLFSFFVRHIEYAKDFGYLQKYVIHESIIDKFLPQYKKEFLFWPVFIVIKIVKSALQEVELLKLPKKYLLPSMVHLTANVVGIYQSKIGRELLIYWFIHSFKR